MSADHYSQCPKCRKEADSKRERDARAVEKLYGKVSADEYVRKVTEIDSVPELPESLREDYEFYLDGEELNINYSASCNVCEFQFKLSNSVNILNSDSKEEM